MMGVLTSRLILVGDTRTMLMVLVPLWGSVALALGATYSLPSNSRYMRLSLMMKLARASVKCSFTFAFNAIILG